MYTYRYAIHKQLMLRRFNSTHWIAKAQWNRAIHDPTSTRHLHMLTQWDVWQVQVFLADGRQQCVQTSMVGLARSSVWLTRSLGAKWCGNPTLLLVILL